MATILCRDLAFSYGDVPLLSGVDLHLVPGWSGLVGANGAGKTTLLRLLAGELEPTAGSIQRDPPDLSLTTCPQSVEVCTPEIERFALADQMRRASRSICANIAEGYSRQRMSGADWKRFLTQAIGSADEMQVWASFARDLGYLDAARAEDLRREYAEIARMTAGLMKAWTAP